MFSTRFLAINMSYNQIVILLIGKGFQSMLGWQSVCGCAEKAFVIHNGASTNPLSGVPATAIGEGPRKLHFQRSVPHDAMIDRPTDRAA